MREDDGSRQKLFNPVSRASSLSDSGQWTGTSFISISGCETEGALSSSPEERDTSSSLSASSSAAAHNIMLLLKDRSSKAAVNFVAGGSPNANPTILGAPWDLDFRNLGGRTVPQEDKPTVGVNASDTEGNTALHIAVHRGDWELTRLLTEQGASVNAHNKYFETPLHIGAHKGYLECLLALLRPLRSQSSYVKKATNCDSISHQEEEEEEADSELSLSEEFDRSDYDADKDLREKKHLPQVKETEEKLCEWTLSPATQPPNLAFLTGEGYAALHLSVMAGHVACAQLLLIAGTDANITHPTTLETPLHLAVKKGNDLENCSARNHLILTTPRSFRHGKTAGGLWSSLIPPGCQWPHALAFSSYKKGYSQIPTCRCMLQRSAAAPRLQGPFTSALCSST